MNVAIRTCGRLALVDDEQKLALDPRRHGDGEAGFFAQEDGIDVVRQAESVENKLLQ